MKHILLAVALVAGTLALAGSATAAVTLPKAYPGRDALIAFPRGNPPHSPRLTGAPGGSRGPHVVLKKEPTWWQGPSTPAPWTLGALVVTRPWD